MGSAAPRTRSGAPALPPAQFHRDILFGVRCSQTISDRNPAELARATTTALIREGKALRATTKANACKSRGAMSGETCCKAAMSGYISGQHANLPDCPVEPAAVGQNSPSWRWRESPRIGKPASKQGLCGCTAPTARRPPEDKPQQIGKIGLGRQDPEMSRFTNIE